MGIIKKWKDNKAMQEMHYLRIEDLTFQILGKLQDIRNILANKEMKGGAEDGKD